jgi:hypothetical protein
MGLLRQIFGPSKEEVWQELCRQIGADFVDNGFWKGGSKVEATSGPWTVTLDTYTVSTGKSSITYTRLRAPYVNRDGFEFNLSRESLFSPIATALGIQDIEIGIQEFDSAFRVQSNQEDQVKKLLANPKLRDLLLQQPSISFYVKDDEGWFGEQFPEGVDELYFQVSGVIKDVERLKALFELFSETLNTLCAIGSAYKTPPFEAWTIPDQDKLLRSSQEPVGATLLRPAGNVETNSDHLVRPADAPASEKDL